MEAVAKFDFMASGEDELSFHTGDILKVGDGWGCSGGRGVPGKSQEVEVSLTTGLAAEVI